MTHLLHVDASPRGDRSVSRALAKQFVTDWQAAHPDATVTYRDLGHQALPFVSEAWIAAAYSSAEQHTPEQAAAIAVSNQLVDEFLAADRYVFSIPMYNFSITANFKAYIDQIMRAGRTFAVTENGYAGLVHHRKALLILSQGGAYPEGSPAYGYDMQTPYLRLVFGFMGITDLEFVYANHLASKGEVRDRAIADAQASLKKLVNL